MKKTTTLLFATLVLCTVLTRSYGKDILYENNKITQNATIQQQVDINDVADTHTIDEVNIDLDNAYNLVQEALAEMGKNPVKRIVKTGYSTIDKEHVIQLSAGDDSADDLKYTALYHFAVSESGKVYYMDITKGADYLLLEPKTTKKNKTYSSSPASTDTLTGMYSRTDSSEINNGVLSIKSLQNGLLLFELNLFKNGKSAILSGIIAAETNYARYDFYLKKNGEYLIYFYIDRDERIIRVVHKGDMTIVPDGAYKYADKKICIKKDSAITLIENIPAVLTSLNISNRPYFLECVKTEDDHDSGLDRFIITAKNTATGNTFAKFSVADDLSSVYRIDNDLKSPVLIFNGMQ